MRNEHDSHHVCHAGQCYASPYQQNDSMKKFNNDPDDVVREALAGMAAAHPDLRVDLDEQIIVRADAPRPCKVGLVSGGGSGHEPLHGGFVGSACSTRPAPVRSSPRPSRTRSWAATRAVDGGAGVVHIVKNYTGDVMNFELAAEDAETPVERVLIDDDVAVDGSTWTPAVVAPARPCWSRRSPARSRRRVPRSPRSPRSPGTSTSARRPSRSPSPRARPGGWQARVRPSRGRDRGRRRHPRRARPRPRAAATGSRPRGPDRRADPHRQAHRA